MAQVKFNRSDINLDTMRTGLQSLEPPKVTAREIIAELADVIRGAVEKGVPYSEILKYLKSHGIELAETTLKAYLRDGKPGKGINYQKAHAASSEAREQGGIGGGSEADAADTTHE